MSGFSWVTVNTHGELTEHFKTVLPKIRSAARGCGYAIGVHGSMQRDLDLIAVPWIENHASRDALAKEIHFAACGLSMKQYQWERKPLGRFATCFPICFPTWNELSLGHVDLSVFDPQQTLAGGEPVDYPPETVKLAEQGIWTGHCVRCGGIAGGPDKDCECTRKSSAE